MRHACALNHLRFALSALPYASDLAQASLAEARMLAPSARMPRAGWRFNLVARLLGWRAARFLQHRFSRTPTA